MNERQKRSREALMKLLEDSRKELEEGPDETIRDFVRAFMGVDLVVVLENDSECGCPRCVARREEEKLTWN